MKNYILNIRYICLDYVTSFPTLHRITLNNIGVHFIHMSELLCRIIELNSVTLRVSDQARIMNEQQFLILCNK